ncbi:glycosyltransferase family 39 protein [Niveibacterium sp. 24ML]|uniref:ArnT family glycosyltransferase n=1 Tax=Niveibacterium sp. 24ML TaxID=2985512 RepID=UPI00226FD796|nr:glycosyltransferase family 39 protein [Niveibacterium sp. 24ML]MCX9158254.1 glycosyltransferase family 39 protein [Niveibacterium sp. 24ML]
MAHPPRTPSTVSLPVWALWLLFALYALPGLIDHGPWRGDDAANFGVVHQILRTGDWLSLAIADRPYFDAGPLYFWVSALLAKLLGGLIDTPNAARLASGLFVAATLICLAKAARSLYGSPADRAAVLLGLGTLGLLTHAHEVQPQLALLACTAAAFLGFAEFLKTPRRGALIAGTAIGLATLAAGMPAIMILMPLWVLLPGLCSECRTPARIASLWLGAAIAVAIALIWPLMILATQPEHFAEWWYNEIYSITPHGEHLFNARKLVELLAWFMWPLWPIALWTIWYERKSIWETRILLPLAALILAGLLVATTGPLRPAHALPLIPPLVLLASDGVMTLRRGAASAFDWFGRMAFLAFGIFIWLAWYAQHFGWPAPISRNVARLVPGYTPDISGWAVALGVALTLGWLALILRPPRSPLRGALSWAVGTSFVWALAITLFLPYADYDKSYAQVAKTLAAEIAAKPHACVGETGMGHAQRAALLYHQDLVFEPAEQGVTRCEWLLVYRSGRSQALQPGSGWNQAWELIRGRRRTEEQFVLYRRG